MTKMQWQARRIQDTDGFRTLLTILFMVVACGLIAGGLLTVSPIMVGAGMVALAFCGVILSSPYLGIIIFLGLLFVRPEQFLPQMGNTGANAFTLFAYLVIALTLFAWLVQLLLKRQSFTWRVELAWAGAFLLAITAASYRASEHTHNSLVLMDALKQIAQLGCFFVLLQQLVNSEQRAGTALKWLVFFTACLALSAIHGYVTGTSLLNEHGTARAMVPGPFASPNALAAALVISVPAALLLTLKAEKWPTRLFSAGCLGILVLGLYLTNSRSGMLALGLGVGVVMIQQLGWYRGMVLAAILGLGLVVFGPDRFSHHTFSHDAITSDDSSMGRIFAWQAGLQMFQSNPVIGVGYQQFTEYHDLMAHNTFMQALAETGLVGAFCWVGMNYWALLSLSRVRRARRDVEKPGDNLSGYAVALQAGLLASLLAGMFLNKAYRLEPVIPAALAAAVAGLAGEHLRPRKGDWVHLLAIAGVVLVGIVVLYSAVEMLS